MPGTVLSVGAGLSSSGAVPISVDRYYNPTDGFNNRAGTITSLGYGWAMGYDISLLPFTGPQKRLVLPGNNKVNFILQPNGTYLNTDDRDYGKQFDQSESVSGVGTISIIGFHGVNG